MSRTILTKDFSFDQLSVLTPKPSLWAILKAANPSQTFTDKCFIALDPGETTGIAVFDSRSGGPRFTVGQIETKNIGPSFDMLRSAFRMAEPDHVRFEDYRIYGWKADDHAWSNLHTSQFIGAIECALHDTGILGTRLLAQNPKKWWTDEKLKGTGMWATGVRHGRDAVRHLLYYMTFPDIGK